MVEPAELPDVRTLLPHGAALVLLDRLVAIGDDLARAELVVREGAPWAERGRVDALVALEYMAQAVAAHFGFACRGRGESIRVGYLVGVREATFHVTHFEEGDRIEVVAKRVFGDRTLAAFECEVARRGETLASALLSVVLPGPSVAVPS